MDKQFFIGDIEDAANINENFREVIYTGNKMQLVLMSLEAREEIGTEIHEGVDQFIRIESGSAKVMLDDEEYEIEEDFAVIIPAGTKHNVVNTGEDQLKLYTIYAPPNHPEDTIHVTKADADRAEQ